VGGPTRGPPAHEICGQKEENPSTTELCKDKEVTDKVMYVNDMYVKNDAIESQ